MSALAEIAGDTPATFSYRRLAALSLAILCPLSVYGAAGASGVRTAIKVPANARQFATPLPDQDAFLLPSGETASVNCGGLNTFLGKLYADSQDRLKDVVSVQGYESEVRASNHHLSHAELTELGRLGSEEVVSCEASPEVVYVK